MLAVICANSDPFDRLPARESMEKGWKSNEEEKKTFQQLIN